MAYHDAIVREDGEPSVMVLTLVEDIAGRISAVWNEMSGRLLPGEPLYMPHSFSDSLRPDDPVAPPSALPPGSLCENCLDAPAVMLSAAPWGGEMGLCRACWHTSEPLTLDDASRQYLVRYDAEGWGIVHVADV